MVLDSYLEPEAELSGAQQREPAVVRVAPPTDGVLQLPLMPQPLHARHATNSHVTKFYLLSWIWTSGCEAFHGKSYDQTMHSTEDLYKQ